MEISKKCNVGSTPLQQLGNTDKGAIYTEPFLTENGKLHVLAIHLRNNSVLGAWKYKRLKTRKRASLKAQVFTKTLICEINTIWPG